VHTHLLEPVEEVKDGIRKTLKLVPPERVWVLPDCGLKTRTVEEAEGKLRVMMDATREVKRELELD
jgi:5-methyltetrahydropteroyltriglutamate--homocysteine methyltransferase